MEENKSSVFFSYSHKDEIFRSELETHLALLHRNGIISNWHFRKITAGSEPENEIDDAIKSADIILLLVSSDFIASDYCYERELQIAMQRHESHQAIIIPIIIRSTDWEQTSFGKLQCLPEGTKAVSTWKDRDEAWLNVVEGIKDSISEIHKLKNRSKPSTGFQSMRDLLRREFDSIDQAYEAWGENKTTFRGLSTGLDELDSITDGLHQSELIALAGRPGMGKTDFAVHVASHLAIKKKRSVAYLSLNLPSDRITRKLIASLGSVLSYRLLRGTLADDDWPRLTSAIALLNEANLYIDDPISLTLDELKEKASIAKRQNDIELLIIDSLQHLLPSTTDISAQVTAKNITREIRLLSRELQIPILVITSLDQSLEKRINKRPFLSDLGLWRTLEEDADTILFLYRESVYNVEYPSAIQNMSEIIVPKNSSDAGLGTIYVTYNEKYAQYLDPVYITE